MLFGLHATAAPPRFRQPDSDRTPMLPSDRITFGPKLPAGAKIGPQLPGGIQAVHVTMAQAFDITGKLPPLVAVSCVRAGQGFDRRAFAMVDGVLLVPLSWTQDEGTCNRAHACLCRVNGVPEERRATCSYRKP